jgi:hypothetical protein
MEAQWTLLVWKHNGHCWYGSTMDTAGLEAQLILLVWKHNGHCWYGSTMDTAGMEAQWTLLVWKHNGYCWYGSTMDTAGMEAQWTLLVWKHNGLQLSQFLFAAHTSGDMHTAIHGIKVTFWATNSPYKGQCFIIN